MHRTREQWEQFNPYFAGSMRSHEAAALSEAKADILELYAKIDRLKTTRNIDQFATCEGE